MSVCLTDEDGTRVAWPGNREDDGWPAPPDRVAHMAGVLEVGGYAEESSDSIVDLLADLMHYAVARGIVFEDELATARGHYEAEVLLNAEIEAEARVSGGGGRS